MIVATKDKHTRASPTINKLITHFELSNLADGKSDSTITWYSDILKLFSRYLRENRHTVRIEEFNVGNARDYVLYLRSRNKFARYITTHIQHSGLSPQTVRGHIRGLKAFSSWLYREQYTDENRLQHLKIPKAPIKFVEPFPITLIYPSLRLSRPISMSASSDARRPLSSAVAKMA